MANLDDLELRVTHLEHSVTDVRQDAAAARVMAGLADRDVSEFRHVQTAHTKVLNAMRETQIEQGKMLAEHGKMLGVHGKMLGVHGQRLDSLDSKVDSLDSKVDSLDTKFEALDTKFEALDRKVTDGFSTMAVGIAQITTLIRSVETKVDGK